MKSPERIARIEAREQKELKRLYKERARKNYVGYFVVFIILIILAHAIDEICSNINNDIQSAVVSEFLPMWPNTTTSTDHDTIYRTALSNFSLLSMVLSLVILIAPFYRSLSDIWGRKIFLVLNILGMGVSLLIAFWSPNLAVYFIGLALMNFFIIHDMQVVYIYEGAPKNKRATIYGLTKCIGTLSILIIPFLRETAMKSDPSLWRNVYFVPAIIAFCIAILLFLFARETPVFIDNRIAYLEQPYALREEKKAQAKKDKKATENAGVFASLKYVFKGDNKDLRWVVIALIIFGFGFMSISQYYESIMSETYSMSTSDVSKAEGVFAFVFAGVLAIGGFIGDKMGRKTLILIYSSISVFSLIMFNISAFLGWNWFVVGLFMSLSRACFFTAYDYMTMMISEKAPTTNRASVIASTAIICNGVTGIGYLGIMFLITKLPIGPACLILSIPSIVIGVVILMLKTKETKGVDLEAVGEIGEVTEEMKEEETQMKEEETNE